MNLVLDPKTMTRLVAETLPPPSQHRIAVIGAVDSSGAQVVVGFTSENGEWSLAGGYRHDWRTGDDGAVAKVMFTR
jgi:hypothetical protein